MNGRTNVKEPLECLGIQVGPQNRANIENKRIFMSYVRSNRTYNRTQAHKPIKTNCNKSQ